MLLCGRGSLSMVAKMAAIASEFGSSGTNKNMFLVTLVALVLTLNYE